MQAKETYKKRFIQVTEYRTGLKRFYQMSSLQLWEKTLLSQADKEIMAEKKESQNSFLFYSIAGSLNLVSLNQEKKCNIFPDLRRWKYSTHCNNILYVFAQCIFYVLHQHLLSLFSSLLSNRGKLWVLHPKLQMSHSAFLLELHYL